MARPNGMRVEEVILSDVRSNECVESGVDELDTTFNQVERSTELVVSPVCQIYDL
jgi:hypothetical protein